MNSRILHDRSGFGRNILPKLCLSGLMWTGAAIPVVQAQGIMAGAEISGVSVGRNEWAYTLTLQNFASSTSPIQMFWFAWEAGQADFLASSPTSIHTPAGWNSVVEGGGGQDGYSIQFVTFTQPLRPGSSVTFTFDSPDSPTVMAGPAVLYPQYETLTSQVYSGHAASGLQDLFIVSLVPEPASWALLGTGALTMALVRRRNRPL